MLVNSRGGGLTQHQWGDRSKEVMFKLWCEKKSWGRVHVQRPERGKNFCAWEQSVAIEGGEWSEKRLEGEAGARLRSGS